MGKSAIPAAFSYHELMKHDSAAGNPTILFGAFDRHNFGDLLFPHIVAALLPDKNLIFAGLAARDLRQLGGHRVEPLTQLAVRYANQPVKLIHVGGEILTCDAWQAAVMLLPDDQVQQTIARFDAHPQEKQAWARQQLGLDALAPYCAGRGLFPHTAKVIYHGVGGVDLDGCAPALRAEVLVKLKTADSVGVRDRQTLAQLERAGIAASLIPDPAVMVNELFGARIRRSCRNPEIARLLEQFPQGYLAMQFSAEFCDDASLAEIARQLDQATFESGYGVVLFRAGAAPWHDDLACYKRMSTRNIAIFESLDLWNICALIAHSQGYCGSSLHGRIVAMAFALPRINFQDRSPVNTPSKQAAFAATWEIPGAPTCIEIAEIASGIRRALAVDSKLRQHKARELVLLYRQGFAAYLN